MRVILYFIVCLNSSAIAQEYLDLFKSNIQTTQYADTIKAKDYSVIRYTDSNGELVSELGFDIGGNLRFYQISPEKYFIDKGELKVVKWDANGSLIYIEIFDTLGNETTWKKHPNDEVSLIKQNSELIGVGLWYYPSGELKIKTMINRDSVFNIEYYIGGGIYRKYYSYKLSNIYFGNYVEYDILGNVICIGNYCNKDLLMKYIEDQAMNGNSVSEGIKHGEWVTIDLINRRICREVYSFGDSISSHYKRLKKNYLKKNISLFP